MKKLILPGIIILVVVLTPLSESKAGGIYVSKPSISFGVSWGPSYYDDVRVDGYWTYNRYGDWIWIDGYRKTRYRPKGVWADGYWKRRHGRWVWVDGYWKSKRGRGFYAKEKYRSHRAKHRRYDRWRWEREVDYRW